MIITQTSNPNAKAFIPRGKPVHTDNHTNLKPNAKAFIPRGKPVHTDNHTNLKPNAKAFIPRGKPVHTDNHTNLKPNAKAFIPRGKPVHTDNHTNLKPNAKAFIPRGKPVNDAYVTNSFTALVMTVLFLDILLLMIIFSNNGNDAMNSKNTLRKLKNDNPNKSCIGHLNINSIRYKLALKELIGVNLYIFLISETKLNLMTPQPLLHIGDTSLSDTKKYNL